MESLLGFLRNPKYKLDPVLRTVQDTVEPMQGKDGLNWGPNLAYMVTGMLNHHPRTAIEFSRQRESAKPGEEPSIVDFFNQETEA